MKYPIPRNVERFFVEKKIKGDSADQLPSRCSFSRSRKSPLMEEYLDEIAKHSKLYQSLPFVETMYLCNSLTFNTLHQDSDIDVFIVAQP
ncbi:MAG: hypothetical protein LBU27_02515 [Candidatus Peribacteria bacterium]|jgi:hypothetical protein|nr:hypothetical protein [Candidatus Peribacteria bacterium]